MRFPSDRRKRLVLLNLWENVIEKYPPHRACTQYTAFTVINKCSGIPRPKRAKRAKHGVEARGSGMTFRLSARNTGNEAGTKAL